MANGKKRKTLDNTCEGCAEKDKVIAQKEEVIAQKYKVIAQKSVEVDMKTKELDEKTNELAALTSKLKERVKCPVCLEVPSTRPIYSCPAGHSVCSNCYRGEHSDCPMCRTKMRKNISLLAVTVIENIEHTCIFEGCEVKTPLAGVEEHRRSCGFRVVACPAIQCKAKVGYNKVMDHVVNSCKHSYPSLDLPNKGLTLIFHSETNLICKRAMFMSPCSVDGKLFFLVQTDGKFKNIYMQMLGSKEDCLEYKISISMKDGNDLHSVNFSGHPSPIDMDEEDKKRAGLVIEETSMLKFCTPMEGKPSRSQYKIVLEFIVLK
jgi:hypothetical protein